MNHLQLTLKSPHPILSLITLHSLLRSPRHPIPHTNSSFRTQYDTHSSHPHRYPRVIYQKQKPTHFSLCVLCHPRFTLDSTPIFCWTFFQKESFVSVLQSISPYHNSSVLYCYCTVLYCTFSRNCFAEFCSNFEGIMLNHFIFMTIAPVFLKWC